jgi:predicted NUDIX family phosphoesterase
MLKTNLEELVFAVPTDDLWNLLTYKKVGFIDGNGEDLNRLVQHGLFRKRSELENDPSFKQIIPYGMISAEGSFLLFTRKSGQTEKRLLNQRHLGVGGHMNPGPEGEHSEQYLLSELKRELFEEVKLENGCFIESIEFIGFINDDSMPVSRVHLGLLYVIRVSNQSVMINETDKMTAVWMDKTALHDHYEEMETWTRIAVDRYIR